MAAISTSQAPLAADLALFDCIDKIQSGVHAKYKAIELVVNGILSKEIPDGSNLDNWVSKCIESLNGNWKSAKLIAEKFGILGKQHHLTAHHIDQFVTASIKILEKGWGSKYNCVNSVIDIHKADLLKKNQKIEFAAICGASIHLNWQSQHVCKEALEALINK